MKNHNALAAALLVAFTASSAHAVVADFNTAATDYTSNFFFASGASTAWSATGGIGGSGGVIANPTVGVAPANPSPTPVRGPQVNTNSVLNVAPNGDVFLSTFFHRSGTDNTSAGGQKFFALGLTTIASGVTVSGDTAIGNTPSGHASFGVGFATNANTVGDVTGLRWRFFASDGTGNAVNGAAGPANFNLADDSWYKLDLTFTKSLIAGQWTVSAALNNYGATGVSAPTLVSSFNDLAFTTTGIFGTGSAAVYGATSIFGGLSLGNTIDDNGATGGGNGMPLVDAFDEFSLTTSAIPEPSSYAPLAGLAGLALAASRRRRTS